MPSIPRWQISRQSAPPSTSGFFTISGNVLQFVSRSIYGDYNQDGSVDAADYVVWRKSGYSQADYNTWRDQFQSRL